VLVDSAAVVEGVWIDWARRRGIDPAGLFPGVHGRRTIETVRELAPSLDAGAEAAELEAAEEERVGETLPRPGALELLETLHADRWAVVTSGHRTLAEGRLRGAGLPLPARLVSADDVSRGKPDPEPYLRGALLLGLDPDQCLAVEDSPAGVSAARAAGMPVFAVLSTNTASDLDHADRILGSLADLLPLAQRLTASAL